MVIVRSHSLSSQLTWTDRRLFRVRTHERAQDAPFIHFTAFRKQVTDPEEVTERRPADARLQTCYTDCFPLRV